MELNYFLYESTYLNSINSKEDPSYSGLLLRLSDPDGNHGYANYHALNAFADVPAKDFLKGFLGDFDKLEGRHRLHMQYLKQDLQNRLQKTDALAGAFQVENHKLITNCVDLNEKDLMDLKEDNFKILKIKMGKNILSETQWMDAHKDFFKKFSIKLRLDFNERLSASEFSDWFNLTAFHKQGIIDFYEDPCPYDEVNWTNWKDQGLRLAKDFADDNLQVTKGISIFILKPALVNIIEWLKKVDSPQDYEYVVTHYMDSPLGMAQAMASALKLKFFVKERLLTCGLLPLNDFVEELNWKLPTRGPHILYSDDLGVGFTNELESIPWKNVKN